MKSVLVFSLILVSSFQLINGTFIDSINNWFSSHFESQLEVRAPLPDTGYWNFLPILGLYGRMLHFLLTDTDGFGSEIKALNHIFKEEYGAEYYTNLESHVAESFPVSDALYKSTLMLAKIRDVRDEYTGKTLGDALDILRNISDDRNAVKLIVNKWHMIRDLSGMFRNPGERGTVDQQQLDKLKTMLLEHPEVFQKVLSQPDVLNRLSGSVLESLKDIDVAKGIESVQEMAVLLKTLYPHNYDQLSRQLLQITDDQTGMSFADALETVSNVMKTPLFQHKLKKLLNTDALRQVHEVSQQPLSDAIGGSGDAKMTADGADPKKVQRDLETQGIFVSEEKAARLIDDMKEDRLFDMVLRVVADAERSPAGLTELSISQSLAQEDVHVAPDKVIRLMQLMQIFPPEMMVSTLQSMGITAELQDVVELVRKARIAAPLEMDAPNAAGTASFGGAEAAARHQPAAEQSEDTRHSDFESAQPGAGPSDE